MSVISACGGGSGTDASAAVDITGLPDQTGCTYRYSLTQSPALLGADPLLGAQWHLLNTGQNGGVAGEDLRVSAAWLTTRGEGARIALVDDSLDTLHPDLIANIADSASYNYRPLALGNTHPLPCAPDDTHGTAVAGILAARDGNGIGGSGVAPRATLVGYNALSTGLQADLVDALNRGLSDNGVYNNSWGSSDDGALSRADASYLSAIDHGIAKGRGGRGAVYVFPAGNGGCYGLEPVTGSCIGETTGLDGYLNHHGVLVACTVDHAGKAPDYAERGATLLVCGLSADPAGPVGITTLSPLGGYRNDFSGSSAAAPMVSGVAALILATNPHLSWRDVRLILARTARRNQPADPGWVSGPGTLAHHPRYGFGVADAGAAVAVAARWPTVGGSASLISCGPYERSPRIGLPDASAAGNLASTLASTPHRKSASASMVIRTDAIEVGPECAISAIEYVEVAFSASHAYAGDLRIELLSPNGRVSELARERVCVAPCGTYSDWRFGSVRHLDEAATGTWTLRVGDAQPVDTGIWQSWHLRLWGR